MIDFERRLPTEDDDIAAIVRGILIVQERYAAEQHRALARGTHAKGVCARAQFEVFDLNRTIADRAVATRLARGLYAKPGVYPAGIRFANGASQIHPDRGPDVRALSFSIQVPPDIVGPTPMRLDFSMNNATTFPINDAHAFAALLKVTTAPSKAKGLLALPFSDQLGFVQTAARGARQTRVATRAYQQMRYWSTVPFRHGPADAVKYSATPAAGNPAQPLGDDPDCLRHELIRHLEHDERMSAFDFGLQFLEVQRMTYRGRRRDASFWIENAAVEWKERQAPFHTVGRLRLLPRSRCAQELCDAMHIDVTTNCLPDHRPLGSINRARWAAESASREARLDPVARPHETART